MSTTTLASAGTAKRIASRKRSAEASRPEQASARTAARSRAVVARRDGFGEFGRGARVGGDVHVDAVVRRRLEADGDQRLGLGLGEVLRLHAVEVGPDRDHDVGLVPQAPGGLDVRREPDE